MNGRSVLVVDDNPNMTVLLSDILELLGCTPKTATDGEAALAIMKDDKIDLVITDLRMPRMDGMALLREIRDRFPGVPVVMISGYSVESTEDEEIGRTADGFLNKPFRVADVEKVLMTHLKDYSP
jgi:CheY-like chemotaxis protein